MSEGPQRLFGWRRVLLSEHGPPATRRHVLLTLSTYGDVEGREIFPSTRELARATGLSRRRVEEHLRIAAEEGWIDREASGTGHGWRQMSYRLGMPENVGTLRPHHEDARGDAPSPPSHPEGGDAGDRGGDAPSTNVGTERPTTSPVTSPTTTGHSSSFVAGAAVQSPAAPSPAARGEAIRELMGAYEASDEAGAMAEVLRRIYPSVPIGEMEWAAVRLLRPRSDLPFADAEVEFRIAVVVSALRGMAARRIPWSRGTLVAYLEAEIGHRTGHGPGGEFQSRKYHAHWWLGDIRAGQNTVSWAEKLTWEQHAELIPDPHDTHDHPDSHPTTARDDHDDL